jgi:hypothetical protein
VAHDEAALLQVAQGLEQVGLTNAQGGAQGDGRLWAARTAQRLDELAGEGRCWRRGGRGGWVQVLDDEMGAYVLGAPQAQCRRRRRLALVLALALPLLALGGVGGYAGFRWRAAHEALASGPPRTLAFLGVGSGSSLESGAEAHAAALENCLLAALARHGRYRLVDRARIHAFVAQSGRGRPGVSDNVRASEAARELAADYVIYGDVAVVSGRPFFSRFCADAATHQVLCGDNLDGLDAHGCDALAGRIAAKLDAVGSHRAGLP